MIPFRHALVTGGGSGVGKAIALALADAGVEVTICGRRADVLETVAAGNARIHGIPADVTDEHAVSALYEKAEAARGPFDIVVANAGAAESAPAHKTTLADWRKTLDVNLTGAFVTVKPALAGMAARKAGRIIFIASTAGLKGYAYVAPYVAAKHGVVGLTKTAALEYAADGIRVNAVCPGFITTNMTDLARKLRSESILGHTPMGRFGEPTEIAEMVVWLCSDHASYVTGSAYAVDGGWTAV